MRSYLEAIGVSGDEKQLIDNYLELIHLRATGQLMTAAAWLRKQVLEHPLYRQDSNVSSEIAYDLLQRCDRLGKDQLEVSDSDVIQLNTM